MEKRRCELCKKNISISNYYTHLKTKKHKRNEEIKKSDLLIFDENKSDKDNFKKQLIEIKDMINNLISNL
jgi:hypothetical protein